MALYGDLTYDSRVRREAATLVGAGYDVSIACLAAEEGRQSPDLPESVRVLVLVPTSHSVLPGSGNPFSAASGGRLLSLARRAGWLRSYVANLRDWGRLVSAAFGPVDIWHLNDLTALAAVAPNLAKSVPFVYDAHELFLETGPSLRLPRPARALLRAHERRLVARASAVLTVNDAVAKVLERRYRPKRTTVLHNCPDRWSPPASRPTLIREAAGIPDDSPVVLYHGGLGGDRGIEQLMAAILQPGLEHAHLVLMGSGQKRAEYVEAADEQRWRHRIHVLDAVPPSALLPWVASADIGAMPIQASTLNHYLSTPNKLFECLAAGIPVVASDFPAMRRVVVDDPAGPLGTVCDPSSVESVARALRSILELDRAAAESLRARCLAAAQNRWNWHVESVKLVALYDELTCVSPRDGPAIGPAAGQGRRTVPNP
jgi:glycosyltransferase involved in cell wall biosynthesis